MDIYHYFGGDVGVSVNGDLMAVDGLVKGQQRILRRLLTNPGAYIWHPTYGGGLPRYVGQLQSPGKLLEIKGVITSQVLLEESVAKSPAPIIKVKPNMDGSFFCSIAYYEAATKTLQILDFTVSE